MTAPDHALIVARYEAAKAVADNPVAASVTSIGEWGPWIVAQLVNQKRIEALVGFGYNGVAVKATRKHLLNLLSKGLRNRQLRFPTENRAVVWPELKLTKTV